MKHRKLSALLATVFISAAPTQAMAGFNPDPPIMTTLALTLTSATTGAGLGGLVIVQRELQLKNMATALLDDLALREHRAARELAVYYVGERDPAAVARFAALMIKERRYWSAQLRQVLIQPAHARAVAVELERLLPEALESGAPKKL